MVVNWMLSTEMWTEDLERERNVVGSEGKSNFYGDEREAVFLRRKKGKNLVTQ